MNTLLATKNIVKKYGKNENAFTALDDINISIKQGETVAITGKSGSGKSTLLHTLALLDKPTSGSVYINGIDTSQINQKGIEKIRNREFGFVFQQFFLNPNDTVLSNVILPLKIAGFSTKKRISMGLTALRSVDLESKAQARAVNLSGGQKQRVAIARALINNPKIIFADEPTGNLDSHTGELIENLLFSLNKDKGITLIFVTHDNDLANKCKRRFIISDGRIITKSKVQQ